MRTIHRDAGLEILSLKGAGDTAVIVFSSLHGNFEGGGTEMVGTATARGTRPAVFVRDRRQAWFQDPATAAQVVPLLRAHLGQIGARRVLCTGASMGAYAAMVFARDLGADAVLAFGPQYDVSRAAMPDDPRWKEYRDPIQTFGLGSIEPWLSDDVSYYVLHGREGADIVHWSRFPTADNLHHYLIPGQAHPVALWLKQIGALQDVFELAVEDAPEAFDARITSLGAMRRQGHETYASTPNDWYLNRFPGLMAGTDMTGTPHEAFLAARTGARS